MLVKPVFTEKSYSLTGLDKFTFRVDRHATKGEIKRLVESLYEVNVISINTTTSKKSSSRSLRTGKYVKDRGYKKAIVRLKSGQKIKLFNA